LGVSRWYQCVVGFVAILLIATSAIFYCTGDRFDLKIAFIGVAAVCAITWGVVDAWRPRQGALHYAAGEWVLAQGELESQGTLRVVLDLQRYLLVRFTPSGYASAQLPASSQQLKIKGQWLHLESAYGQDWRALRRALYAAPSIAQSNGLAGATSPAVSNSSNNSSAIEPA
jgi:hypothetical protein